MYLDIFLFFSYYMYIDFLYEIKMKIHTTLIFPFFTFSSSKCFWGFRRKDYSFIGEYYECLKAWPMNATMYAIEMAFLDAAQC